MIGLLGLLLFLPFLTVTAAQEPTNDQVQQTDQHKQPKHRILPLGEALSDARLEPLRTLDSYFPFTPPESVADWRQRAEYLRLHLKVSLGLWPMPTKTPLNSVIHGRIDQGDYLIEKVFFESMPGFYVTGNLYRPKKVEGKVPGVLCPHGHYANGRFRDAPESEIDTQIESGAEKFRSNARSPLQARCAHLARMGCIVFHYDMLGYADSQQISDAVAHRFRKQREHMNDAEGWGLFSPRAESHLQSVMGLQTWNSIRALDFLESIPEVDTTRLAVTGSSGGGTQTFILCAIDPRPAVAFPAVMVSTAMQGGCTCENCCNLRVGTGNVEIAALFAPKPLGLTAADDWTKEMETKGFPELQKLYKLLGKPDNVQLTSRTEFPHNYNQVCREAMYRWFDKHLGLNGLVEEQPIEFLSKEQLTVFDDAHPRPEGGEPFEKHLLRYWREDSRLALAKAESPFQFELDGLEKLIGFSVRNSVDGLKSDVETIELGEIAFHKTRVSDPELKHEFFSFCVNSIPPSKNCVLWLHTKGKHHLLDDDDGITPQVQTLIENGFSVMGLDLFLQGEFLNDPDAPITNRQVQNGRDAAGYTYGYNHPVFVSRVRDVVRMVVHLENIKTIVALDDTAPIAVVAAVLLGDRIDRLAVNTGGVRLADAELFDANFFPGGAKYGDIPGFLRMSAPRDTWISGEMAADEIELAFRERGAADNLVTVDHMLEPDEMTSAVVEWIIERDKESD